MNFEGIYLYFSQLSTIYGYRYRYFRVMERHRRTPGYRLPVPFKYITCPDARCWGTWRARGGGSAGGGVQSVRARVYLKPCGILTAGPCPSLRPLWGAHPGAPGRGTR